LETVAEIVVSPEHDAEVRRITVVNHGEQEREIELTSYAEVVLAPQAADLAHPAFSNMFVETEFVADAGTLLFHRRARAAGDSQPWGAHVLSVEHGAAGPLEFETSRARFVGRGRTLA